LVDLLDLIRQTPSLDWLVLSKRIGNWRGRLELAAFHLRNDISRNDRMQATLEWIQDWLDGEAPANAWIGATVVNQAEADRDVPKLLATSAEVRFLSMEPLLGQVDFAGMWVEHDNPAIHENVLERMDWIIVGGESGHQARPMHPDWVRSIRDQCQAAGVPFLFKQWGEFEFSYDRDRDDPDFRQCQDVARQPGRWINLKGGHGFHGERVHYAHKVGKKTAGRLLDGREWSQIPEPRQA